MEAEHVRPISHKPMHWYILLVEQWWAIVFAQRTGLKLNIFCGPASENHKCFSNVSEITNVLAIKQLGFIQFANLIF